MKRMWIKNRKNADMSNKICIKQINEVKEWDNTHKFMYQIQLR